MLTVEQVTNVRNDLNNHFEVLKTAKADDAVAQKDLNEAVKLAEELLAKLEAVRNRLLEI